MKNGVAYKKTCSFQLPVLDALIKFIHVAIYSIYCNFNLEVRNFPVMQFLFISR